ncbi:unnamed protein product, partial [Prorocentrum cordatum]
VTKNQQSGINTSSTRWPQPRRLSPPCSRRSTRRTTACGAWRPDCPKRWSPSSASPTSWSRPAPMWSQLLRSWRPRRSYTRSWWSSCTSRWMIGLGTPRALSSRRSRSPSLTCLVDNRYPLTCPAFWSGKQTTTSTRRTETRLRLGSRHSTTRYRSRRRNSLVPRRLMLNAFVKRWRSRSHAWLARSGRFLYQVPLQELKMMVRMWVIQPLRRLLVVKLRRLVKSRLPPRRLHQAVRARHRRVLMPRRVQPRFYNQTPPKVTAPEGGSQRDQNFLTSSNGGGTSPTAACVLASPEWISQGTS